MLYRLIDQVSSGDVNGRNIYGANKTILVKEDVVLTVGIITKLKKLGISGIFIKNNSLPDIKLEENVSEQTKIETLACLYYVVDMINSNYTIDIEPIKENINKMIEEIESNKDILVQFTDIRSSENEVFIHTLHVCIVATTIGSKLNINRDGLKIIAATALLHEMINTDQAKKNMQLLNKTSAEVFHLFEEIERKIRFFQNENIPLPPYKSHAKKEIQQYAEIIAIANCIDNLSSQFSKTPTLPPYEAIEFMMTLTGKLFHIDVMNAFIRSFSVFPNGHSVKLNNGKTGFVVRQNPALPTRPVVGVFEGDFQKEDVITLTVDEYNLAVLPTLFISEINSPNSIAYEEERKKKREAFEKEKELSNKISQE